MRYVGEPVAVIVAASRQIAEDAAPLVEVEYEMLAPCVDIETALDRTRRWSTTANLIMSQDS